MIDLLIYFVLFFTIYSYWINRTVNKELERLEARKLYCEKWIKIFADSKTDNFAEYYENQLKSCEIEIEFYKNI